MSMTPYAQARQRGDTRGEHYAAAKARSETTIALAKHIYGARTKRFRAIKKMMERGSGV